MLSGNTKVVFVSVQASTATGPDGDYVNLQIADCTSHKHIVNVYVPPAFMMAALAGRHVEPCKATVFNTYDTVGKKLEAKTELADVTDADKTYDSKVRNALLNAAAKKLESDDWKADECEWNNHRVSRHPGGVIKHQVTLRRYVDVSFDSQEDGKITETLNSEINELLNKYHKKDLSDGNAKALYQQLLNLVHR